MLQQRPILTKRYPPWYKELVLVGCEKLAFPNSYVEAIRAVPGVKDFDDGRHQANRQVTTQAMTKKC